MIGWDEMPIDKLQEFARRDGCLEFMVPSDLRQIVARLERAEMQVNRKSDMQPYEVLGTTFDGVQVLAPAVPSKNFTRDEIHAAVKGAMAGLTDAEVKQISGALRIMNRPGDCDLADKVDRMYASKQLIDASLINPLRSLVAAVGASRVPQNTEEVALQLLVTLGPAFENARAAIKAYDEGEK